MKRIDKLLLGLVLGSIFPILLFLTGWWTTYKNIYTHYYALGGLIFGLLINVLFLKKWISQGFKIPAVILIGIYVFYNIGIFGFFMGFPVFNLFMGVIAGYYFGKRIIYNNISITDRAPVIKKVSFFTGFIMLLICIASGLIAMIDNYAGKDLQNMLGLEFEVSKAEIMGIILVGGSTLIIIQYFVTKTIIARTINHNESYAR